MSCISVASPLERPAAGEHVRAITNLVSVLRSEVSCKEKINSVVDLLEICNEIDFNDVQAPTEELFDSLLEFGSVPTIPEGNDRELNENDFHSVDIYSSASFRCYEQIINVGKHIPLKKIIIPCLLLCAQHARNELWTSMGSVIKCQSTLVALLRKSRVENILDLLRWAGDLRDNLSRLLTRIVHPYLTRDNWKCNPGRKSAFGWCLSHIKHPYMELVLNEALPPSLLFVDDFVVAHRLFGIKCLCHIMDYTPKAELERYGRAEVIYGALKNLIYTRESSIVIAIYPCLLKVLAIIEPDPRNPAALRKTNRYDVIFETVLQEMDSEQTIALRTALSEVVPPLIHALGITVVKQMKMTIQVLLQYLEVYDSPEEVTRQNCLKALVALISVSWPRISHYMQNMLKGLIRLLYDIHGNDAISNDVKDIVIKDCTKCLKMLHDICEQDFNAACRPILEVEDIPALHAIKSILRTI